MKKIKYTKVPYYAILLIFILFQLFFYNLTIDKNDNIQHMNFVRSILTDNPTGGWLSHMKAYPLFHITTRAVAFLCMDNYSIAGVLVLTFSNVASIALARKMLIENMDVESTMERYIVDIISIAYVIIEPLAGGLTDGRIYARQCGPNPWHNPTITFVRPLGMAALIMFIHIIGKMREGREIYEFKNSLIGFSALSVLSVLAKPSFMMVYLPAMGLYTFGYWMKDFRGRLKNAMSLLVAVVPTLFIVARQATFFQYENSGTSGKVQFLWGGFSEFTTIEIIKVCIASFPIPLVALLLYRKAILKDPGTIVSYIALGIGTIQMYMFTNGYSGDFSWGYDLAVGLTTITVLGKCISMDEPAPRIRIALLYLLYAWQTVVGVVYVITIYQTGGETWF